MRRFIGEDETPPAVVRHRNKAADARHGFGSPDGMELKDMNEKGSSTETAKEADTNVGYSKANEPPREYESIQALADMESPPPALAASLSMESETPTPPALRKDGRVTPPDVADEIARRSTASPTRDTPAGGVIRPSRHEKMVSFPERRGPFVSPATSNISTSSSPHDFTTPPFRPTVITSPMTALSAASRRNQPHNADIDPIRMGTPRSSHSGGGVRGPRFSDVAMTPERGRRSDAEDSASESDSSVKEPFSDQVKSLNKLLLSTDKRLGALGRTSWTPERDNDDLTQEEEELEEIRRQLQQELSLVDFSILKGSPSGTPSYRSHRSYGENVPDDESPMRLHWSTLDQTPTRLSYSKATPTTVKTKELTSRTVAAATPSSISSSWGRKSPDSDVSPPPSMHRRSRDRPTVTPPEIPSPTLTANERSSHEKQKTIPFKELVANPGFQSRHHNSPTRRTSNISSLDEELPEDFPENDSSVESGRKPSPASASASKKKSPSLLERFGLSPWHDSDAENDGVKIPMQPRPRQQSLPEVADRTSTSLHPDEALPQSLPKMTLYCGERDKSSKSPPLLSEASKSKTKSQRNNWRGKSQKESSSVADVQEEVVKKGDYAKSTTGDEICIARSSPDSEVISLRNSPPKVLHDATGQTSKNPSPSAPSKKSPGFLLGKLGFAREADSSKIVPKPGVARSPHVERSETTPRGEESKNTQKQHHSVDTNSSFEASPVTRKMLTPSSVECSKKSSNSLLQIIGLGKMPSTPSTVAKIDMVDEDSVDQSPGVANASGYISSDMSSFDDDFSNMFFPKLPNEIDLGAINPIYTQKYPGTSDVGDEKTSQPSSDHEHANNNKMKGNHDSSGTTAKSVEVTKKGRRESAPDPPTPSSDADTSKDYTVGTLQAQDLLNSLESIFFGSTQSFDNIAPGNEFERRDESFRAPDKDDADPLPPAPPPSSFVFDQNRNYSQSQRPKPVKRSSSIGGQKYPSDERGYEKKAAGMPIRVSRMESMSDVHPEDATMSDHKVHSSSIGSQQFRIDEQRESSQLFAEMSPGTDLAEPLPKNPRKKLPLIESEVRKPSKIFDLVSPIVPSAHRTSNSGLEDVPLTPDCQKRRKQDPSVILQSIASIGSAGDKKAALIIHEDGDVDSETQSLRYQFPDSPQKKLAFDEPDSEAFDLSRLPLAYSADTVEEQNTGEEKADSEKKENSYRGNIRRAYCLFLWLILGAALFLSLWLFGVFQTGEETAETTPSLSASVLTSSFPTPRPSAGPSLTANPTTLAPTNSPSVSPTAGPTTFTVSFQSAYEISVGRGFVDQIPQELYMDDLVESMDRLLSKSVERFPSGRSSLRRRLEFTALPSSIEKFEEIPCPVPSAVNRCEKVFASVTLEDAKGLWTDFKILLDLAIVTGELQSELEQVNPNSPVSIIDLIPDSQTQAPSVAPTTTSPTQSLASTPYDLLTFLSERSFDKGKALAIEDSPQYRAYLWLSQNVGIESFSKERILQRYALSTFYFSTRGDGWFFREGWMTDEDECSWYSRSPRKSCDRYGRIRNLELDYNNVNGELPPELGLLSGSLESIVLRGGPFTYTEGTIPSELGMLTNMRLLFLRGNKYHGTIPTELGRMSNLEQLDLAANHLTGMIPAEFGQATNLTMFDISRNQISGQLPPALGKLEKCLRMNVESNLLTGAIPTEIGNLRRLQSLHGASNRFSSLPSEIGRLTFLDTLSLEENALRGTIPSELSRIRRLFLLGLAHNMLSGPIPSELGSLFDMRDKIDLSHNHLTGQIPSELGNLNRLRVLELEHNKLTGTLPSSLSALSRVTTMRIDSNGLTGTIPQEVCATFNSTFPALVADCSDFLDNCPCCTTCCDNTGCKCRYIGTPQQFLCYHQKK